MACYRENFTFTFTFKGDGVTGEWRKLHNEELNGLYSSPNIIRMIKSGRIRWAGHVYRVLMERDHLEDPDVVGKKILK